MKKLILVSVILLSFIVSKAQESVLFKIKYLPNNLYESTINTNMNMEMNFSGDSASLQKIKNKGIKLPMIISSVTNMIFSIKTGGIKNDKSYDIEIAYKDIDSKEIINDVQKDSQVSPLKVETIFGYYTADGKMHVNSMSGGNINEQIKEQLEGMLQNLINQIKFPDQPMKIGDTFDQEVPFNLPLAGEGLNATIKIIYILNKIENGKAFFDLDESMDLNLTKQKDSQTINVTGNGVGKGNLIYDIKNSYAYKRNATLAMNYKMLIGTLTLTGKADIASSTNTQLISLSK